MLRDSSLIARRLTSARLMICAAPSYLQRAGGPWSPADLSRPSCLTYADMIATDTWLFEAPDERSEAVRVTGPLTTTCAGFMHEIALVGHGIMLEPSFAFEEDVAAGRLVPLLTGWHSVQNLSVHALYPHRSLLSAKVRCLVDLLAERLAIRALL